MRYIQVGIHTVTLLGEEEVGLAGGRKIGDTVACVEERRALVGGQLGVRAESEGLVVAKTTAEALKRFQYRKAPKILVTVRSVDLPVVVVLDLPATLLVDGLVATGNSLVADNVNLVAVRADELLQDTANDGCHAGGDNNGGDVVRQGPLEVLVEVRVESDVFHEVVDTLREGAGDGVHHLTESIPA